MKKKKKISMAWFLFFAAVSCLLPNQWKIITAVLAGLMIAWWLTSRIKVKLFYAAWLIFPLLCFYYLNSTGDKAVVWCEKNSPSVVVEKADNYFEEISGRKPSEELHRLINRSSDVGQELLEEAKTKAIEYFPKSIRKKRGKSA